MFSVKTIEKMIAKLNTVIIAIYEKHLIVVYLKVLICL